MSQNSPISWEMGRGPFGSSSQEEATFELTPE